jgi:hypothetical protein
MNANTKPICYMQTAWIPESQAVNLPSGWIVLFKRPGELLVAKAESSRER